jgi:maltose O-acetyltransferase
MSIAENQFKASASTTPNDSAPSSSKPPARGGLAGFVTRLREDLKGATHFTLFSSVGASPWLPRDWRRRLYNIAGASMKSPPGMMFTFVGNAQNLTIGSLVYMNRGVFIEAISPVTIDDSSGFGMEAMILTSHHPFAHGRIQPEAVGRPVTIGKRVWIGARAVILPGAVIEDDVVIAAGAVVTGTCESYGVYAGVPARRIRDFSPTAD